MFGGLSEIIAVAVHWFSLRRESDLALTSGRTACFYNCFASFLGNHKDGRRHQTCQVKQKIRKWQMLSTNSEDKKAKVNSSETKNCDHFSTISLVNLI